jgi:hypothetical protein
MAGETTVIHLPFAGGIDENVAKQYLDASSRQASILNGDFVKTGAIDKRKGLEHLTTTLVTGGSLPAMATGTRVVGWSRSSLSILCSTGLYQYVETSVGGATGSGVVGTGLVPAVGVLRRPIVTGDEGAAPVLCDLTYGGRLLRITVFWDSSYNILASVIDVDSGNTVLEATRVYDNSGAFHLANFPVPVAAFDLPGVADGDPRSVIVIHDKSDFSVSYVQYDPSANSFTSPTTMVADCGTVDAAPYEDDPANGWLLVYDTGGAILPSPGLYTLGTNIRVAYWTPAGGASGTADRAIRVGDTLNSGVYVCGRYAQSIWAIWATSLGGDTYFWAQRRNNTGFSAASVPYAFDQRTGLGFYLSGCTHLGTDKIFVTYHYKRATTTPGPLAVLPAWRVLYHTGGFLGSWAFGLTSLGLAPATRPFVVNEEVYQAFYYDLQYYDFLSSAVSDDVCNQATLYLCKFEGVSDSMAMLGTVDTEVCRPVATVAPRVTSHAFQILVDTLSGFRAGFPSSVERDTTRVAVGLKTRGLAGETQDGSRAGPSWAVDFLFDSETRKGLYQSSEMGSELSLSGGVPFVADGQSAFEDGFFNYPEFSYVTVDGATCSLPTGDYVFAVTYRAVDSAGLAHESAPFICAPVSVTSGGSGPVLHITPPLASYRDSRAESDTVGKVFADVYMTTVNGSTLYYKDSIVVSNLALDPVAVLYPTDLALAASYVFTEPDTTGRLLYTTGGVMDNVNPPASSIQTTHQKRRAIVDETRRAVWFSKQFSDGVAPGFNETLYVPFPEGGDITALASFEGRFIAFKSRSIWVMSGEGPSATGLGSSWTSPELLTSDVGCKSWQSVVATPNGLMFQAPNNGLYLLGRDLQVSFIGANVVDSTADFPDVVGAVLVPLSGQVRFLCLNDAGDDHLVVVYDYLLNAWLTHQYDRLSDAPVSICLSNDSTPRYTVLTADGNLWQERLESDSERYKDQNSAGTEFFVPTVVTTPFVKLQVQGYHKAKRVQFFGEQQDDCGLEIELAFNYDDTVRQTSTWSSTQLRSLGVRGQVESYVGNAYNKQMAVQVTISDTEGAAMTTGAGMRFAAIAIELQNLGPRYKLLSAGARR